MCALKDADRVGQPSGALLFGVFLFGVCVRLLSGHSDDERS